MRLNDALKLDSPVTTSDPARETSTLDQEADFDPNMSFSSSTKENDGPAETNDAALPARSSTLSWQRRPTSRGGPGTRPLSMVAAQNATQRSLAGTEREPQSAEPTESNFSREQIAQSLGSKDPTWFRQTADRGLKSAAYRKNQVEDDDRSDVSSGTARLPGMSADISRDRSPSESTTNAAPAQARLASPLPLNPPGIADSSFDESSLSEQLSRPATDRGSPTRSTSPTKGMGGFVQSAMMKRSDSVKRWSVQSPPGLARADSVTSMRPTAYGRDASHTTKPQSANRDGSTTPTSSRPTSKHGNSLITTESVSKLAGEDEEDEPPVPTSPSKTMDPRRWSPTKSSWLDSALNKPESPKVQQKPHMPTQPAWMAQLNKNKADRAGNPGSADKPAGAPGHKHQVSIGGLMRSSPMGASAKNTPGLGGVYSPPVGGNRPPISHASKPSEPRGTIEGRLAKKDDEVSGTSETDQVDGPQPEPAKQRSVASPPPIKPKPETTTPAMDLRASLKQRSANAETSRPAEPEFKNALGSLRRTKTQNYVAPDELKNNIMRGKAALSVTGGPQKSERKDEFKDAILKKKDEFKKTQAEGKGVTRTSSLDEDQPVPEGLTRRAELGRTLTGPKRELPQVASKSAEAASQVKKANSPKPSPKPKRMSSQTFPSPRSSSTNVASDLEPPKRVNTEPETRAADKEPRAPPTLHKETSAPSNFQGRAAGGKLSDRFNPALAGLLARGPPPMASEGGQSSTASAAEDSSEPPKPGPQLTHMTKGRARGPRRKAPTSTAPTAQKTQDTPSTAPVATTPVESPRPVAQTKPLAATQREKPSLSPKPKTFSETSKTEETAPAETKPSAPSIQEQVASRAALRNRPAPIKPVGQEEVGQVRSLPFRRQPSSPEKPIAEPVSPIKPHKTGGDVSQPGSPRKLDAKRMSRFLDDSATNTSTFKQDPPREPIKLTRQRTGSVSPVKSFARPLPDPSSTPKVESRPAGPVESTPSKFSAGFTKSPSPSPGPKPSFTNLGSPMNKGQSTPPSRGSNPRPLPETPGNGLKSPPAVDSPMQSPTKQASELQGVLIDFFGPQRPVKDHKIDAAHLITQRPEAGGKVSSFGYQMFRISGDGKKAPLQANHERTLFEQEMYVCAHEFEDEMGKKGFEIYFWVGDEVAESQAEDAQLFAAREARSVGGKLIKLRQGKESTRFLQALGGTVITRRGSSNKFDSLAPSILCGRRYLGQVVFDEVDFSAASLCAGFPYLIAQGGKCYLWKGKGSNVDELSCARLVGMESSMTGDIIEYEEGSEPASFWELFGQGPKAHSADHWRLKPNFDKYSGRLFCSDADSRQQVSWVYHPTVFLEPNTLLTHIFTRSSKSTPSAKPIFPPIAYTFSTPSLSCTLSSAPERSRNSPPSAMPSTLRRTTPFSPPPSKTAPLFPSARLCSKVPPGI